MADLKKILANANKNWKKAKKRVGESEGFAEYEDGRYTARLVSAKLGTSEGSGRAQIAFGWKFEDGDYEGKTKISYQGIESEDNLYYLGRDLERLGYELPDDLGDLPEILKDIEKTQPVASITLKTKEGSDFQNLYIRKVFSADEVAESDEDETDTEEEAAEEEEETEESEEEESDDDADAEEEETEEESEEEEETEEEEEAESEDEDEVELKKGMRVIVETRKGREPGSIIELLEKEGKVRVKLDNKTVVRVGPEALEIADDGEEEEEEAPAAKPAKKAAPAPAKKTAPAKKAAPAKKKGKK